MVAKGDGTLQERASARDYCGDESGWSARHVCFLQGAEHLEVFR